MCFLCLCPLPILRWGFLARAYSWRVPPRIPRGWVFWGCGLLLPRPPVFLPVMNVCGKSSRTLAGLVWSLSIGCMLCLFDLVWREVLALSQRGGLCIYGGADMFGEDVARGGFMFSLSLCFFMWGEDVAFIRANPYGCQLTNF